MFFVEFYGNKNLIISNAVEAKLVPEANGVRFNRMDGKMVAFYKLDSIKGFYNNGDANASIIGPKNL